MIVVKTHIYVSSDFVCVLEYINNNLLVIKDGRCPIIIILASHMCVRQEE